MLRPIKKFQSLQFSLIELLIVLAIFLALASILMPSLKRVEDKSKQTLCLNNLRKVSHGFSFFSLDHNNQLPLASWGNNDRRVIWGWDDYIQPYFNKEPLTQLEIDKLMIKPEKSIDELHCPSSLVGKHQEGYYGMNLNYVMPLAGWKGTGGTFVGNGTTGRHSERPSHRPLIEIQDPSHTLLLVEIDVRHPHFVQGAGRLVSSPSKQVHEKSSGLSLSALENTTLLLHPNFELSYLFVDGHVEHDFYGSPSLIGKGTTDRPKGAWTVEQFD